MLISTGMSFLHEVDETMAYLMEEGQEAIGLFHCTSLYPTRMEDANLLALRTLQAVYPDHPVGFSDHTEGIDCAVAAIALGARMIEKHFTLDRKMKGPDHFFSSTPDELKRLVQAIRNTETALGSLKKEPVPGERPLRKRLRRTLVAAREIRQGEILSPDNVETKRTDVQGIDARLYHLVEGKEARDLIAEGEVIRFGMIQDGREGK